MAISAEELVKKGSLRRRISIGAGLLIFFGIFLSSALVTWNGFSREVDQQIKYLTGTAKVFSSSIAEAVSEDDKRQVQLSLTSIGKIPGFEFASVKLIDGSTYTEMGYGSYLKTDDNNALTNNLFGLLLQDRIWIEDKIISSGSHIGTMRLLANIQSIRNGLITNLSLNFLSSLLFAMFAFFICWRFISSLTKPLHTMSLMMNRFVKESDHSIRAEEDEKGELGVLAKSFNSMMDGIADRDASLLEHQRNLEKKVEDRTADLLVATKEAQAANDAKSEFLATMSHEIRTPMNGMLVMAELLATAELPAKHRRYAEIVLKSGNGLLTIINDILDFSKIQSGHMTIEAIDLDLQMLVEDVMNLFWQPLNEKGLEIGCFVENTVPANIKGDPTRLNQIISNLLNNALKFTKEGEIGIHLSTTIEAGIEFLKVEVNDTGIGIPQDKIESIFEDFKQVDQTTTRQYGGTGLGLTICKKLVEAMDGNIWIESEVGVGSSFIFTVPLNSNEKNCIEYGPAAKGKIALIAMPDTLKRRAIIEQFELFGMRYDISVAYEVETEELEKYDWIVGNIDFFKRHYFTNENQVRITVSKLGDTDLENLLSGAAVHDVIMEPVSSFGIQETINRIQSGDGRQSWKTNYVNASQTKYESYIGTKVLVAEDSAVNREVVQQALKQFEIEPVFAVTGLEAVDRFKEGDFDLVFMDCNMPAMNGFDASVAIRKIEVNRSSRRIPIIALTAHLADRVESQMQETGMDDLVVKPFTMNVLQEKLSQWLASGDDDTKIKRTTTIDHLADVPSDDNELFDISLLSEIQEIAGDGFEATLNQLRNLYLDSASPIFDNLREAFAANDFAEIAKLSHSLKSMSLNIGAKSLGDSFEKLELAANHGECLDEFSQAEQIFVTIIGSLSELVREHSNNQIHKSIA